MFPIYTWKRWGWGEGGCQVHVPRRKLFMRRDLLIYIGRSDLWILFQWYEQLAILHVECDRPVLQSQRTIGIWVFRVSEEKHRLKVSEKTRMLFKHYKFISNICRKRKLNVSLAELLDDFFPTLLSVIDTTGPSIFSVKTSLKLYNN